jgi:uncharacterized membrane protein
MSYEFVVICVFYILSTMFTTCKLKGHKKIGHKKM